MKSLLYKGAVAGVVGLALLVSACTPVPPGPTGTPTTNPYPYPEPNKVVTVGPDNVRAVNMHVGDVFTVSCPGVASLANGVLLCTAKVLATPTMTVTEAPSATHTASSTPTNTETATPTASPSATATPNDTASPVPTQSPGSTATSTSTAGTVAWSVHTRLTKATEADLLSVFVAGDHGWLNPDPPDGGRALYTFNDASDLDKHDDAFYTQFSGVNFDCEVPDASTALVQTQQIRGWVDTYNKAHPDKPLLFHMFAHLELFENNLQLVTYADTFVYGKDSWNDGSVYKEAKADKDAIMAYPGKRAGFRLGVLLANFVKQKSGPDIILTQAQIESNIHAVVDPEPKGLGLDLVSFYFGMDTDDNISGAIKAVRAGQ